MNVAKDPLDLAYFVIGVRNYLCDIANPRAVDGGELEFVSTCLPFSAVLDIKLPENFAGVFVYDIAEPVGKYVARLVGHGAKFTMKEIENCVAELINTNSVNPEVMTVEKAFGIVSGHAESFLADWESDDDTESKEEAAEARGEYELALAVLRAHVEGRA